MENRLNTDCNRFDGFGSYPDYMQFSNMFKNIGRIGIETYLLFQHHTTLEILRNVSTDTDLFTITGTGWHFVKFLGPAVAVVGPDTRSERNPHQVMAGPTYQGIFPKIAMLPQSVQHCILMIAVPVVYPRLDNMEQIASTVATGKKAVTGAYNVFGKVTSSVAGVVGAKGAVGAGFDSVKRAVGKSGLMGGILNPFGDIDVLDEMKDQWTHESKACLSLYIFTIHSILTSPTGPRTHLPNPNPPIHLPQPLHPLYFLVWRLQHRRRRPATRSLPSLRPQNNVPTHFILRRRRPTQQLHPQTPQLQQTTLHTRQRHAVIHRLREPTCHRHERGHDGDLPN